MALESWIWFPALVLIGVLAIGSTASIRIDDENAAALWLGFTHGFVCFGLLAGMFFVVPRYIKILENLNVALPTATNLVIRVSDTLLNFWYLIIPQLLFVIAAEAFAFFLLKRNPPTRTVATVWSVGSSIALGLVLIGSLWTVIAPMNNLQ